MKLTLALVIAAACGKSESSTSAPAAPIDVAGVNALVPAELKGKLEFEQRDVVEERGRKPETYTLAAPKGWTQDMKSFAKLQAGNDLGFMTSLGVGSNCDGACQAKDWAKVSEKTNFAQFRDAKLIKDEPGKTSHLMIAEKGDSTYVLYAWWRDGGTRYYTCMATLEAPVRAAAPAFAKACQAVRTP